MNASAPSNADRPDRKNILIVTQDFPPVTGGIQTYVFELARHFLARGHRVTVVCPGRQDTPSPLPPQATVIRIRIHTSWLFLPLLFRLPGILRRGGYTHVLYAQWQSVLSEAFVPSGTKSGLGGYQSLCLVHGRETLRSIFGPLHNVLCRFAFRRVDVGIPNSRAVRDLTLRAGRPARPLHLVHPAVNPDIFRPTDAAHRRALREHYGIGEGPVLLGMARMVKRKNMDGMVRAFPGVLRAFPDAWLVLAGDGPEREALGRLATELGCASRVLFPGVIRHEAFIREHGASFYSIADVFAMPCRGSATDVEGFGIVYLEAGACEVPVIGSRVGGIPDAVVEGVTGLLVDPARPAELEAAFLEILNRTDRGKSLGIAARARILRELTWEASGDAILDLMA
jgi:phosphatidylinositol alpha-1,6-mannosyltransferase